MLFAHITPAFLIAATCLFGLMALHPILSEMREKHAAGVREITPELNEIQAKWKAKKNNPNWRNLMNREMSDAYHRAGLWVPFPFVMILIYLAMWGFLIVSTADMIARGLGFRG